MPYKIQTCRNQATLQRFQSYRLGKIGTDVHSGRQLGGVCRQRMFRLIYNSDGHTIICHFNEVTIEITLIHYLTDKITDFEANSHTFAVK